MCIRDRLNSVFLLFILIAGISVSSVAQEAQYTRPSWWFGAAAGANFNFYQGSTQKLNADFSAPVAFHEGNSVSLFAAPTIEFYMPGSGSVSYTHLRAHETVLDLVCRLMLEQHNITDHNSTYQIS